MSTPTATCWRGGWPHGEPAVQRALGKGYPLARAMVGGPLRAHVDRGDWVLYLRRAGEPPDAESLREARDALAQRIVRSAGAAEQRVSGPPRRARRRL